MFIILIFRPGREQGTFA